MAAGVVADVVAAGVVADVVAAGVVVDVVAAGVVGGEELDFLDDLLDFVLGARCDDFFCVEGLQIWHLNMAFLHFGQ